MEMNRTNSYKLNLNLSNFSQQPEHNNPNNPNNINNLSYQPSNDLGRLSRLASPIQTTSPTPNNSFLN